MSCRNYETILTEVARGQMLDARAKTDALAHAEACARCAARLADERALSAGLRALDSRAAAAQMPDRVEEALLAAFRQRSSHVPSIPLVRERKKSRWGRWSAAAAAAILVASTFAALRLLPAGTRGPAGQGARISEPALVTPPGWMRNESIAGTAQPRPQDVGDAGARRPIPAPQLQPNRRDPRPGLVHNARFDRGRARAGFNPEAAASSNDEITTDFMPLTYGGGLAQIDDGQVVRVELPRSALHSFGLPVNAERGGERVKADVLLGHDGVARAIRFVR